MILSPKDDAISNLVKALSKEFMLTDEGSISIYLDLEISKNEASMTLWQPYLIERIIKESVLENSNPKDIPVVKPLLQRDDKSKPLKKKIYYIFLNGMLSYLIGTRPEICMAVNQTSKFCSNLKTYYYNALKRIIKYLIGTKEKGIILKPDILKGLECYVDADFAGDFDKNCEDDPSNVLSRTSYIIKYTNCPILFVSKIQREIALLRIESEYIALSITLRDIIPLNNLIKEISKTMDLETETPKVIYTIFKDNNGTLELVTAQNIRQGQSILASNTITFKAMLQIRRLKSCQSISHSNKLISLLNRSRLRYSSFSES